MRTFWALALVAAAVGCASTSSDRQSVPVISEPSGATALTDNQRITTPGNILVPFGARELEIRIELEGYEPQTVLLTRANSSAFTHCLDHAITQPSGGGGRGGSTVQGIGSGIAAIGIALAKAATGCSSGTDVLEPTFVMVKLAPLELPPVPIRDTLALR